MSGIKFSFQDPLFNECRLNRKVLDLSATGLAFQIPEKEKTVFEKGMILTNAELLMNGESLVFEAEIRHVKELPRTTRGGGFKVGIAFKKMSAADAHRVASFVFEESRKLFAKFV